MKRVFFGIVTVILLFITGCNFDDDSYSLGDVWIGMGIVDNIQSPRITMDNGVVLVPVAYNYYPWSFTDTTGDRKKIENGDRVLVNFTVLDDERNNDGKIVTYYVRVNSVKKVLMKDILEITPEVEDSIGNDPIIVKDYWVTGNLLNLELKYWGRKEIHFINLVKQPGVLTADKQPFELELRHNDNGDERAVPYVALVSFRLERLKLAGLDSVRFKVKSTGYDGKQKVFEGVYEYDRGN